MKRFMMCMMAVGFIVSCGLVTGCSKSDEDPWLLLVAETSPELSEEQKERAAVVLDRLFEVSDIPAIRRWEDPELDARIMMETQVAIPGLIDRLETEPSSERGLQIFRDFPEFMEVCTSMSRAMLSREVPGIPDEDLEFYSGLATRAMAEFMAENEWFRRVCEEQLSDPIGRRLGIEVTRVMPWILYGDGPCPIPQR